MGELIATGLLGFVLGMGAAWMAWRLRVRGAIHMFGTGPGPHSPRRRASAPGIERLQRQLDPLIHITRSPLVRVLPVGQVKRRDDVTVEFVYLELREAGGLGLIRAHMAAESARSVYAGEAPPEPTPRITDDAGTHYQVTMPSWMGGELDDEAVFRFAPTPPPQATRLLVRAPRTPPFGPAADGTGDREWVFPISLA